MLEPRENPHLIGQIALEEGHITPAQLESAIVKQAARSPSPPLGRLLVESGALSEAQLAQVVRIQETRFEQLAADPARGGLFGQLAVRLGYLKQDQLHDALREQQASGRAGTSLLLGQLLLRRKALNAEQYLEILRRQEREVARCPGCGAFYDLTGTRATEPFLCTGCHAVVHPKTVKA
jgi:hypothetical protein